MKMMKMKRKMNAGEDKPDAVELDIKLVLMASGLHTTVPIQEKSVSIIPPSVYYPLLPPPLLLPNR